MWMTLTLLSLVSQIPSGITLFHACIPNSQFRVNERMCVCDPLGRWSEASCEPARRFACTPGQNIWENCNHCICQENGNFMCVNMCADNSKLNHITKLIDVSSLWCIPFVYYYINCSLCVCPTTGKMIDARCTVDTACPFRGTTDYTAAIRTNVCIPKVMYVFPCLRCLCSEEGTFAVRQCVETCSNTVVSDKLRRCEPRKFFRWSCNICFCPNNGIVNERLCTKSQCGKEVYQTLSSLKSKRRSCLRQMFTTPKCFYCVCGQNGKPNENACLETDCLAIDRLKNGFEMAQCTLGEMVPNCMECFCLRNGLTDPKYCTEKCSQQHKIAVLESVIKDSYVNRHIVDMKIIPDVGTDVCATNSIYTGYGKYCLCPENGETDLNLCTSILKPIKTQNNIDLRASTVNIDFDAKCDPKTFVQFDCNSCYCSKSGHIDPKWCTYDDCQTKRYTMENNRINYGGKDRTITECVPGSMSKEKCNYCICPDSGIYKNRVCTKNNCIDVQTTQNELICEPLTYYAVDCNICYCPKSGIKNIAKCTKQTCEKNFLRSEACIPGRLFSDECNVCVCPPNGNKVDRICTTHICVDSDTAWKKIFKLSQNSLTSHMDDSKRELELCFPGEEFEVGCKVCLCSEMGLRAYATCTEMFCLDSINAETASDPLLRTRRKEECTAKDVDEMISRSKNCTPGSIYVTRCRECICPFEGNINHFCRPLPEADYCEQPLLKSESRRRRVKNLTETTTIATIIDESTTESNVIHSHDHSVWSCDTPGTVMDACYICDCDEGLIVKEHCFYNDNSNCTALTAPTFLVDSNNNI